MKPKLVVPEEWERLSAPGVFYSWNWTLIRMIVNSGVFEVATKQFPIVRVPGAKNGSWCMFELDGKLVGLDTWDTFGPTQNHIDAGFYEPGGVLHDLAILLKIQYFEHEFWETYRKKTGKPVSAWTIFPCHHFPLGYFQWQNKAHKYIATCTGKNGRFGRQPWVDFCRANADFYCKQNYNDTDPDDIYRQITTDTKWGLSLKGKWSAVKNRRETEYASCGMPLALNYKPSYPFEFEAGRHYVLLEKPDDLAKLREIDPVPYSAAATQAYNDYFSPIGMSNQLIKLVKAI